MASDWHLWLAPLTGTHEQRYWLKWETADIGLDSSVSKIPAKVQALLLSNFLCSAPNYWKLILQREKSHKPPLTRQMFQTVPCFILLHIPGWTHRPYGIEIKSFGTEYIIHMKHWPFSKPRLRLGIRLRLARPCGCFDKLCVLCVHAQGFRREDRAWSQTKSRSRGFESQFYKLKV